MNDDYISGVPTMIMLPARNYKFKIVLEECEIRIPREGKYHEICPDFFGEDAGEFKILDNNAVYLPSVTKVLFAVGKYPDLPYNQVFAPIAIVLDGDDAIIIGQVLEFSDLEFAERI